MAVVASEAVDTVKRFLALLRAAGIGVEKAVLFGSHARGDAGKWSDMDVAIVSPDFTGTAFYDRKMLVPYLLGTDSRIEIHPFRPEDFTEDDDFVREIVKTGVEL